MFKLKTLSRFLINNIFTLVIQHYTRMYFFLPELSELTLTSRYEISECPTLLNLSVGIPY